MKLTIINGSTCFGKSTVIKYILKQKEGLFYLSYDSIKWQFSNYASGKYKEDIYALLTTIAEKMFDLKYDMITDMGLSRDWQEKFKALAVEKGYEITEITLEADYDVLEKRFDERVANALAKPGARISNTSKERFKELHGIFQANKNPDAFVIRTDTSSVEEVEKKVLELM